MPCAQLGSTYPRYGVARGRGSRWTRRPPDRTHPVSGPAPRRPVPQSSPCRAVHRSSVGGDGVFAGAGWDRLAVGLARTGCSRGLGQVVGGCDGRACALCACRLHTACRAGPSRWSWPASCRRWPMRIRQLGAPCPQRRPKLTLWLSDAPAAPAALVGRRPGSGGGWGAESLQRRPPPPTQSRPFRPRRPMRLTSLALGGGGAIPGTCARRGLRPAIYLWLPLRRCARAPIAASGRPSGIYSPRSRGRGDEGGGKGPNAPP